MEVWGPCCGPPLESARKTLVSTPRAEEMVTVLSAAKAERALAHATISSSVAWARYPGTFRVLEAEQPERP
jgi:hypothetical protein